MTESLRTATHHSYARAVSLVRRGPRTILFAPRIHMGVGNYFYLWLWGDARQARGLPDRVLRSDTMNTWLQAFPTMEPLVIARRDVRFRDLRALGTYQGFGENFSAPELEGFLQRRVLPSTGLLGLDPYEVDPRRVVVNVRRGDYYSNPEFRRRFGFNIVGYLREAFRLAAWDDISAIHVVSDGLDWCRTNLAWLDEVAPLSFATEGDGAMANLREVASARRLVLTNSTFSYWAGYISNVLHGDNHAEVVAPLFHDRTICDGLAYQLDPRWTAVRCLPNGWDE